MARILDTQEYGRSHIQSHFSRCASCNRLTLLSSYRTTLFFKLFKQPILPVRQLHILDECPECGSRGSATERKFNKERKRNLAEMMEGFTTDEDNPDHCAHALHTLMVYNEASWFKDVQKSYGLRFENNGKVQHVIAQGLCRFGEYKLAMDYCRKAIVLGAGQRAEELMAFCQKIQEATAGKDFEHLRPAPESARLAFLPIVSITVVLLVVVAAQGISAMRNYRAWLVNGSLNSYVFQLDDTTYTLFPGERKAIKLELGEHALEYPEGDVKRFDYSIPFFKQILQRNLLVINPDAMALIFVQQKDGSESTGYSHSKQIHILPGVGQPLFGFGKEVSEEADSNGLALHRPETHMAMIAKLRSLGLEGPMRSYSRRALEMNPASDEAGALLDIALADTSTDFALEFLQTGLDHKLVLMDWHKRYQDAMIKAGKRDALIAEYSERFKNHPNEPEYAYLLGRAVENPAVSYKFLEQSEKGEGMGGLGFSAIARDHFLAGRFDEALGFSRKALERNPTSSEFLEMHEQILLALRKYDDLLEHIRQWKKAKPEDDLSRNIVLYLTCAGYHREAEAEAARLSEEEDRPLPILNAVRFYAVGNMPAYFECLSEAGDPHAELELLLHKRNLTAADRLMDDSAQPLPDLLVLYCSAMNENQPEIAQRNLEKAIAEAQTPDEKAMVAFLSSPTPPDPETVQKLDIGAPEKALLFSALGFRFPEQTGEMFAEASTYNFNIAYPQLLIKQWISRHRQASADKTPDTPD